MTLEETEVVQEKEKNLKKKTQIYILKVRWITKQEQHVMKKKKKKKNLCISHLVLHNQLQQT